MLHLSEVIEPQIGKSVFVSKDMLPLPEPLEEGYGWSGVRSFTDEYGIRMQCHVCGEGWKSVGQHVHRHGLSAASYKRRFGLRQTAGIIGLEFKGFRILQGKRDAHNLVQARAQQQGRGDGHKVSKTSMERTNHQHQCDNQLASRYHNLVIQFERLPTSKELGKAGLAILVIDKRRQHSLRSRYPKLHPKEGRWQSATLIMSAYLKVKDKLARLPTVGEVASAVPMRPESLRRRMFDAAWSKRLFSMRSYRTPQEVSEQLAGFCYSFSVGENRPPTLSELADFYEPEHNGLANVKLSLERRGWLQWLSPSKSLIEEYQRKLIVQTVELAAQKGQSRQAVLRWLGISVSAYYSWRLRMRYAPQA